MKLIVAVNNFGYIGKNGKMMWKCKEDMIHFRKLTTGKKDRKKNNILIMGGVTYKNLPIESFKGRSLCVITSDPTVRPEVKPEGVSFSSDLLHVVSRAYYWYDLHDTETWVVGGQKIYKSLIYLCDEIHMSIIDDFQEGDTKFEIPSDWKGKVFKYYFKPDDDK